MKFRDFLETIDDETIISIGSAAAFFFIGTKRQFFADLPRLEATLKRSPTRIVWNETFVPAHTVDYIHVPAHIYKGIKVPKQILSGVLVPERTIKKDSGERLPYTEILEREVKNFYNRLKKEDGVVIILEGLERGRYWDIDEYTAGGGEEETDG